MFDTRGGGISRTFAIAVAAVAMVAPAAANADTQTGNLSVSATVTKNCTITTSPVAFGSVNTLSASNVDASGGIAVTCTNGTGWTASAGVGGGSGASFASRKMTAGSNTLNYTLYTDSARSTVWGDGSAGTGTLSNTGSGGAQNVTVYGRVPGGQNSAPAGDYSDSVLVTVTY